MNLKVRVAVVFLSVATAACCGQISLPNLLSDHAVLQRDVPLPVWGMAAAGEQVRVAFHQQTVETTADKDGHWNVMLKAEPAGGPYQLVVRGKADDQVVRNDVMVGDVWIAAGQSNMELPLEGFRDAPLRDGEKEIAAANHPQLRLLQEHERFSDYPLHDIPETWAVSTPESARSFSGIGYFFGRDIQQQENVFVGVVAITYGNTPIRGWVPQQAYLTVHPNTEFAIHIAHVLHTVKRVLHLAPSADVSDAFSPSTRRKEMLQVFGGLAITVALLGLLMWACLRLPNWPLRTGGIAVVVVLCGFGLFTCEQALRNMTNTFSPGTIYNADVAPVTQMPIKGVLWYQGESDAPRAETGNYLANVTAMIGGWREHWRGGDFPIFLVQLTNYERGAWGPARDEQRRAAKLLHAAMVVSLDVGDKMQLHPPDKQTIAHRLVLSASQHVYGRDVEGTSPTLEKTMQEGSALRVWLTHADGLHGNDAAQSDFEIAGDNRVFAPAIVEVQRRGAETTLLVSAPNVPAPKYVRYGWAHWTERFYYNAAGLPLGTFTSEFCP